MISYILLAAAAFLAGAVNAVAGGGSFFTFPALVFTGVPSIIANASSTVALLPSSFASAWTYRDLRRNFEGVSFKAVLIVSIIGGTSGALPLLLTPQSTFDIIVPWLLLLATLICAFGPSMGPRFETLLRIRPATFLPTQFLIGVYAGYFGGAVGLIMLATYSLFGLKDFKVMNANKTLLGGIMNAAACVLFILARKVWWAETSVMLIGAALGGYIGAHAGRRLNSRPIRIIVTVVSIVMTIAFFIKR
jgi:uncharacterized membrane protein YfcA